MPAPHGQQRKQELTFLPTSNSVSLLQRHNQGLVELQILLRLKRKPNQKSPAGNVEQVRCSASSCDTQLTAKENTLGSSREIPESRPTSVHYLWSKKNPKFWNTPARHKWGCDETAPQLKPAPDLRNASCMTMSVRNQSQTPGFSIQTHRTPEML